MESQCQSDQETTRPLSTVHQNMADWEESYIEAQAKQRTAYLCREMVQPLSVSLYDRIPALALVASRHADSRPASEHELLAAELGGAPMLPPEMGAWVAAAPACVRLPLGHVQRVPRSSAGSRASPHGR